jgi:hypothetical protein
MRYVDPIVMWRCHYDRSQRELCETITSPRRLSRSHNTSGLHSHASSALTSGAPVLRHVRAYLATLTGLQPQPASPLAKTYSISISYVTLANTTLLSPIQVLIPRSFKYSNTSSTLESCTYTKVKSGFDKPNITATTTRQHHYSKSQNEIYLGDSFGHPGYLG